MIQPIDQVMERKHVFRSEFRHVILPTRSIIRALPLLLPAFYSQHRLFGKAKSMDLFRMLGVRTHGLKGPVAKE